MQYKRFAQIGAALAGPPLARTIKTEAFKVLIKAYTGESPIVQENPEYTDISFTPEQVTRLQSTLKSWHEAEPGEVRVNVGPVLTPFYIKKYLPYMAGIALAGILIGRLIK